MFFQYSRNIEKCQVFEKKICQRKVEISPILTKLKCPPGGNFGGSNCWISPAYHCKNEKNVI
jgi:hypothetical protein